MPKSQYNEHNYFVNLPIPQNTPASAPVGVTVNLQAAHILGLVVYHHFPQTPITGIEHAFRVLQRGKLILPENGVWVNVPTNGAPVFYPVGYKMEGPPWDLTIQGYDVAGTHADNIGFYIHVGDYYEMDVNLRILETLQEIAGRPSIEKPKTNLPIIPGGAA